MKYDLIAAPTLTCQANGPADRQSTGPSAVFCQAPSPPRAPDLWNSNKPHELGFEVKLRIPSYNMNMDRVPIDCRDFLKQLFDPRPW